MIKLITIDELRPGMFIHKLEVWWIKDQRIHNEMLITDPRQIAMLRTEGIRQLWIDLDRSVQAPIASTVAKRTIGRTPFFQELDQAQQIFLQGKPKVLAMFNEARLGNGLKLDYMMDLVDEIAGSITREPSAMLSVARLKNHDDYTYLHSMAVCGLMIALGKKLGLDEQELRRVGMGGLLHDVGKAAVPLAILNKAGKLTEEEFRVMREHPVVGAQMLIEADADDDLLDITLHHHEKYDGSGYPHRLKGEAISFYARMAAVCDVYDAVTSIRSYRNGWTPAEAMHQMLSWRGHFDPALLHTFVRTIGIYPVGSLVRLASGRVALVVKAGEKSLMRPCVHVFWSLHAQREVKPEELDLGDSFCTDSIVGAEDSTLWGNVDLNRIWALEVA
ncbi:HD-GYP domain-containing protein [Pantoea agglomerans]|uniref:HD-GYP domain-containing protein n=1 Tax=Enterobacter agglomerans TaxID=549 RepID=UPI003C7CCEB2